MIKLYTRGGCNSSLKAKKWFQNHALEVNNMKLSTITYEDLIHLLSLSEGGIEEIMKNRGNCNQRVSHQFQLLNEMTVSNSLNFLKCHTEFLQSPIILSQNKYMLGFHSDDIRQFLPADYRKQKRKTEYLWTS